MGSEAGDTGEDPVEADKAREDLVISGAGGEDQVVASTVKTW
mgnify:FL=1